MQQLAGKPVVVEVERQNGETASLKVNPAYYSTLPIRLKMGKVAAVRDQSPAASAGLKPNDVIQAIGMEVPGQGRRVWILDDEVSLAALVATAAVPVPGASWSGMVGMLPGATLTAVDPLRLPFELRSFAALAKPSSGDTSG